MSYTNFINNETITIMQGIGGIRLCEEAWMKRDILENSRKRDSDSSIEEEITHECFRQ